MTVRMMSWNIRTGGGDRLPAIVQVINEQRPDILALQELRDFQRHDDRRMREVAEAVGMTAHLARSLLGQPVAVLVRPPLRISRGSAVTWRLHHAASIAELDTAAGPLTVISAHLNPFWPYRRMREARWLAARYAGREPVLVAGDLNGLAPDEDHTAALAGQPPLFRKRHIFPDGTVDSRAVGAFLAAGLVDLWKTAGEGDGLTVPTTRGGGREFGAMRLDYVLASASLAGRAREMRVVRGGATEYASDHYPVRVDLTLP